jgi:nucleoside-diphosphate-sugar epimerase
VPTRTAGDIGYFARTEREAGQWRALRRAHSREARIGEMTTVLITGAAGFIGSHLAEACLARGWRVKGVDALTPYYDPSLKRDSIAPLEQETGFTFVEGDLRTVDAAMLLEDVDVVFHLAAQVGVRSSWGDEFQAYVDHNVTAMQRLLDAARDAAISRFVFSSSSSVYGDAMTLPTPEDCVLRPVSPYGATKALGEHLAHAYWKSYGVPVVTLRYFTVYGPRQRPDMAFRRVIDATLNGAEISVYGDGRQTRDFTYVDDTVAATLAAALHGRPGRVYNVGGGSPVSMNEVIALVAEMTETTPRLTHEERQRGDARDTAANIDRARAELGFEPAWSIENGIRAQVEWQRAAAEVPLPG